MSNSLAAGTHTLQLWYRSADATVNHWNPAANRVFLDITGFTIGSGTLVFNPLTARPNSILFHGDSIVEAEGTEAYITASPSSTIAPNSDSTHGWPANLALGMNAEYSMAAFGGQGWVASAADGVTPGVATTYSLRYSGVSMSYAGLTHVIVQMGTNGNTIGPTGTVSTYLTNVRAKLASDGAAANAKIIVVVPFNGSARTALLADFTAYQGAVSSVVVDQTTSTRAPTTPTLLWWTLARRRLSGFLIQMLGIPLGHWFPMTRFTLRRGGISGLCHCLLRLSRPLWPLRPAPRSTLQARAAGSGDLPPKNQINLA